MNTSVRGGRRDFHCGAGRGTRCRSWCAVGPGRAGHCWRRRRGCGTRLLDPNHRSSVLFRGLVGSPGNNARLVAPCLPHLCWPALPPRPQTASSQRTARNQQVRCWWAIRRSRSCGSFAAVLLSRGEGSAYPPPSPLAVTAHRSADGWRLHLVPAARSLAVKPA